MKTTILISLLFLVSLSVNSQNENKKFLLETAVKGLLQNETIQKATFERNGEKNVYFEASTNWVSNGYSFNGNYLGINYNIWLAEKIFFYDIKYYIEIYEIEIIGVKLIVKYETKPGKPILEGEYFKGTMKMEKLGNQWTVTSNKLKK